MKSHKTVDHESGSYLWSDSQVYSTVDACSSIWSVMSVDSTLKITTAECSTERSVEKKHCTSARFGNRTQAVAVRGEPMFRKWARAPRTAEVKPTYEHGTFKRTETSARRARSASQAQGEEFEKKNNNNQYFFALLPSCVTLTSRSPRACLRLTEHLFCRPQMKRLADPELLIKLTLKRCFPCTAL